MLIIAHLHEGFTYVKVFAFHNAIGLRVIRGDLDVMDAIFLRQVTHCSHKCGAIISNNLGHSTPSAKDILKYKVPESLLIFLLKRVPLGPGQQGTVGLNKIAKLVDSWHDHCVNMNLPEKCGNVGNSGWKVKMMGLVSLARVAC